MVSQGAKTVVSLKKKGYRIFVDGKCVVGARTSPLLHLFNPPVVFISIWQSFKTCSRAAQTALEGRMRPAGRSLPTPTLNILIESCTLSHDVQRQSYRHSSALVLMALNSSMESCALARDVQRSTS